MELAASAGERRVEVRLTSDTEEAELAYRLIQSGRLHVDDPNVLPLPFRGQFLFKLPAHARPITVQVSRLDPSGEERLAGRDSPTLLVAVANANAALLDELMVALRDAPPINDDVFGDNRAHDEFARVREMTHAQRIIYATRAGQTGRNVLMQQPNPLLLLYLCKNPQITLPEIISIARLPSIDALVADYLARLMRANPQWAVSEELKVALVMNPKTPGGTALSLLGSISGRQLRQICKRGEVRSTLKQAAIRLLSERRD